MPILAAPPHVSTTLIVVWDLAVSFGIGGYLESRLRQQGAWGAGDRAYKMRGYALHLTAIEEGQQRLGNYQLLTIFILAMGAILYLLVIVSVALSGMFTWIPLVILHVLLRAI
jgi:hypothetical protein